MAQKILCVQGHAITTHQQNPSKKISNFVLYKRPDNFIVILNSKFVALSKSRKLNWILKLSLNF